jgi:hypothetical protein
LSFDFKELAAVSLAFASGTCLAAAIWYLFIGTPDPVPFVGVWVAATAWSAVGLWRSRNDPARTARKGKISKEEAMKEMIGAHGKGCPKKLELVQPRKGLISDCRYFVCGGCGLRYCTVHKEVVVWGREVWPKMKGSGGQPSKKAEVDKLASLYKLRDVPLSWLSPILNTMYEKDIGVEEARAIVQESEEEVYRRNRV